MGTVAVLSAADIDALITPAEAVGALRDALVSGSVDPELDDPRLFSPAPGGEFLLMPARGRTAAGVKVLTVAPGNPARGKPKIQGVYVLVDSDDLAPRALLDGPELTLIRTPAVTVLAIGELVAAGGPRPPGPLPVVVYGTGPQARRHLQTMRSVLGPVDAAVIGRRPGAITEFIGETTGPGLTVRAGRPADLPGAAVVLAATSSPTPVVDHTLIGPQAVVAAVGAHGADNAELPPELVRRADVVVEARASAMREGGNLLVARTADEWATQPPANLTDLVTGRFRRRPDVPAVYSGVGMSWEDLVLATTIVDRHRQLTGAP